MVMVMMVIHVTMVDLDTLLVCRALAATWGSLAWPSITDPFDLREPLHHHHHSSLTSAPPPSSLSKWTHLFPVMFTRVTRMGVTKIFRRVDKGKGHSFVQSRLLGQCIVLKVITSNYWISHFRLLAFPALVGKDVSESSKGHFTENCPLFWLGWLFRGKLAPFLGLSGILSDWTHTPTPYNIQHAPKTIFKGKQQQSNLIWWY